MDVGAWLSELVAGPLPVILVFLVLLLAAERIGHLFALAGLPVITGFLFAGILCGPDVLQLVDRGGVDSLNFVNQVALAVIAFAAGNELLLTEYRSRFRSIGWVTAGQTLVTVVGGSAAMFVLVGYIPVLSALPGAVRLTIAAMTGTILLASSPSSAIAVVSELRAKGPVTQTVLGTTVVKDVIVILLFAVSFEFTKTAVDPEKTIDLGFFLLLIGELALSGILGVLLWRLIVAILSFGKRRSTKALAVVASGYAVFLGTEWLEHWTQENASFSVFLEPLLICMIAGILVTNYSDYRTEFSRILHSVSAPVYLAFFTLTGAAVDLGVLIHAWQIAMILLLVRMVGLFGGSYLGGTFAGDSQKQNGITWLGFVTQAGVGIGLATGIATEEAFPWGRELATLLIAGIIINQIIGPPLFKWAVTAAGERRKFTAGASFGGTHVAVILGHKTGQPLMLARRLVDHGWTVTLAIDDEIEEEIDDPDLTLVTIPDITASSLDQLNISEADALISVLGDQENVQICNLNSEKYGVSRLVVKLEDSITYGKECHDLGALVMCPKTSMVSLLEHFVISPTATSILLDLDPEQEVIEVAVRDPSLEGVPIRDLKIPHSVVILSVTRDGHALVSHGHLTLQVGDQLTVVGPPEVLPYAAVYFDW